MPDQNQGATTTNPAAASAPVVSDSATIPASDTIVIPNSPDITESGQPVEAPSIYTEVTNKISDAHNVLIALSSDPSVDELAAAIGLSLYLDKLGKRATAIYSGKTPNALEFLKPEETFEPTVDTLQDFVIALNKDKADHLRYKLDGEYVKIYITPYRTRIAEEDLEFSYGDFNVDLVLALDVANGIDLDSALREHGRIMHDAVIINITTGNPGKFGEIEWSDKSASSVSEMIAKLLLSVNSKTQIEKEEATAFLTGIVAATNRFSNASTTPETMQISSRLMKAGANQQLISKNITPDTDNEMFSITNAPSAKARPDGGDSTKLDIKHGNEEEIDETKVVDDTITEKDSSLLDDLKAAEASLSQAGAETTPDTSDRPVKLDELTDDNSTNSDLDLSSDSSSTEPSTEPDMTTEPETITDTESTPESEPTTNLESAISNFDDTVSSDSASTSSAEGTAEPEADSDPTLPPVSSPMDFSTPDLPITDNQPGETVITPTTSFNTEVSDEGSDKYGKMLEEALANSPSTSTPKESTPQFSNNPASVNAPTVASAPEINGVPEMNYMPMPGDEILPPPPTPPIDMSTSMTPDSSAPVEPSAPIAPAAPVAEPTPGSLGPQPAMQDQVYAPQVSDPGAFKIPGM